MTLTCGVVDHGGGTRVLCRARPDGVSARRQSLVVARHSALAAGTLGTDDRPGDTLGGGCPWVLHWLRIEIALLCDIRVAADDGVSTIAGGPARHDPGGGGNTDAAPTRGDVPGSGPALTGRVSPPGSVGMGLVTRLAAPESLRAEAWGSGVGDCPRPSPP